LLFEWLWVAVTFISQAAMITAPAFLYQPLRLSVHAGPSAHLIALTGPGQDYAIEFVPDAGTAVGMLGLAFMLAFIARWWSVRRQALALGKTSATRGDSS
jgi:hypothetical protein